MSDTRNILIVEDDEEMCGVLNNIFASEGYNIWVATTGKEALNKIKENNIDLIIMDYKLPDMTGKKILELLRSKNKKMNTIIISAYGTKQIKQELCDLGAIAFFDKPFELNKLMKISQTILEQ